LLEFEHKIYPEALRLVASRSARVSGNKVQIEGKKTRAKALVNPPL